MMNYNSNSYNSEGNRLQDTQPLYGSSDEEEPEAAPAPEDAPAPEESSYIFYSWDPNQLTPVQEHTITFFLRPDQYVTLNE